jgi:hypothetical protein
VDVMRLFKKDNRIKTCKHGNSRVDYNSKIKDIDDFLEKNEDIRVESKNNVYVEKRESLIPHKPKYFEKY